MQLMQFWISMEVYKLLMRLEFTGFVFLIYIYDIYTPKHVQNVLNDLIINFFIAYDIRNSEYHYNLSFKVNTVQGISM